MLREISDQDLWPRTLLHLSGTVRRLPPSPQKTNGCSESAIPDPLAYSIPVVRMIGYFPPKSPDENLYSLACRYKKRLRLRSDYDVSQDLFGVRLAINNVQLPCRLEYLVSQLPHEFGITVDSLISETTSFPYFSPFLQSQNSELVLAAMRGQASVARGIFTGLGRTPENAPRFLRLCTDCCEAIKREADEASWQRCHQLPSVQVCDIHASMLNLFSMPRGQYIAAEDAVRESRRVRRPSSQDFDILLWLSNQARWLANNPQSCLVPQRLRSVYLHHLHEEGYASLSGRVRVSSLTSSMLKRYQRSRIGECLGFQFTEGSVMHRIRRVTSGYADTTDHLILMHFLGISASSMFRSIAVPLWFEAGPWPCLNPICCYYGRDVVEDVEIDVVRERMIGRFTCDCGFVYERIGPDQIGSGRIKPWRSVQNDAWDKALTFLWNQSNLPLKLIRDRLSATYVQLERARQRLNFNPSIKDKELRALVEPSVMTDAQLSSKFEEKRDRYRGLLNTWLAEHPNATRTMIWASLAGAHWMSRYDREWLTSRMPPSEPKEHLPSGLRKGSIRRRILKSDEALAAKVPTATNELLMRSGQPRRITASNILTQLGIPRRGRKLGARMALTEAALERHAETVPQIVVRRMKWLVHESRSTGKRWSLGRFLRRANLSEELIAQDETVAQAFAEARLELGI